MALELNGKHFLALLAVVLMYYSREHATAIFLGYMPLLISFQLNDIEKKIK